MGSAIVKISWTAHAVSAGFARVLRERSFPACTTPRPTPSPARPRRSPATTIQRRDPTAHDVQIEILFCGICHSDLHQARNEWSGMPTVYPCVPGHEIVGRVTKVGSAVTRFKTGDLAGVGCLVDSDGTCPECQAHHEQFCPNAVFTYNAPGQAHAARSPTAATRTASSWTSASSCASPRTSTSPGAAPAPLRRHHDLVAPAPPGRHEGQEGRRGRPRRPRATWA